MIAFGTEFSAGLNALHLLVAALVADAVIGNLGGPFRLLPHPVRLIGGLVGFLETRLNRARRAPGTLFIRGALVALFVAGLAAILGGAAAAALGGEGFGWVGEIAIVAIFLGQRSLFDHSRAVGRALIRDGLAAGRRAVGRIVGRDTDDLDDHGVARAAIESCAEGFCDAVVAPAFWYVLFGLPGLFAYIAVNTMDSMIGHRDARFAAFGRVAARLDDAMNLVPARLAGMLIAIAALFTPTANPARAVKTMFRDARKHRSPNSGWPEAAMAGALGLALLGPRRYGGEAVADPWIGDGEARATAADIRRALYVFAVAGFLHLVAVVFIALALDLA